MGTSTVTIKDARQDDTDAIRRFGQAVIPAYYTPLIGASAAQELFDTWWLPEQFSEAIAAHCVVVAELDGALVGIGERGQFGQDHVIYKLYVDPAHRGHGIGPRLIDALIAQLPGGVDRVLIEHVAANERAAAFYQREGFTIDHIDPHRSGDARQDTVWRARKLGGVDPDR